MSGPQGSDPTQPCQGISRTSRRSDAVDATVGLQWQQPPQQ